LLLPERFAEGLMNAPQASPRFAVAQQIHDTGMLLQRSRNGDE
jgi:hypothetical protein